MTSPAPKQRTILIVGGGFIGLALAARFLHEGDSVRILSRRRPSNLAHEINFIEGDQSSGELMRTLLPTCDVVIHAACATTPGSSARNPIMEAELNITPTLTFLEHCQSSPPSHLLYISSGGTLYGNPGRIAVTEEHPPSPISYHGAGKLAVESAMRAFGGTSACAVTILRPSNVYGPGQNLRTGFGVIRTLLECLRSNQPMEIWGDGSALRDYLFIDDLVDACWRALLPNMAPGTYNVGSGQGVSLTNLIKLTETMSGQRLDIHQRPSRRSDVEAIVLDASKLKQATGWQAQVDLAEGLNRTWLWLLAN
jgi:UDP-glucose 4-epimerase